MKRVMQEALFVPLYVAGLAFAAVQYARMTWDITLPIG